MGLMSKEGKSDNEEKWKRFEDKIKAKRDINTNRKKKAASTEPKLRRDELVVQRLSATVSGKAQKFSRIGPREFVPYPHNDLTVRGIKDACLSHFGRRVVGMECDILAGEQGPSCNTLEQISHLNKVIHVRFVNNDKIVTVPDDETSDNEDSVFCPISKKKPRQVQDAFIRPNSLPTTSGVIPVKDEKVVYPKSLSISQILQLGKLVKAPPGRKILKLFHFDLEHMAWSDIPTKVECQIENDPFAQGGFRSAYRASIVTADFSKKKWVIKKFLPDTVKCIEEELNQTVENQAKKGIQVHYLARNFAKQMHNRVQDVCKADYGNTFFYSEVFLGKDENEDVVTIEEFVEGEFVKYINNNGVVCENTGIPSTLSLKAQSLVHFSFEKSGGKIMLLDLQGSGYHLFDPEIASRDVAEGDEYLFSAGNLSDIAIDWFVDKHKCNVYCEAVGLIPFKKQ